MLAHSLFLALFLPIHGLQTPQAPSALLERRVPPPAAAGALPSAAAIARAAATTPPPLPEGPAIPLTDEQLEVRALGGVGMNECAGDLWAAGPTYKARFDAQGAMVVAPLGAAAPRSLPVWFDLQSISLGRDLFFEASAPVEPSQVGMTAIYEHGAGIQERYDARVDGLEQSFVIAALPEGSGDLIVRIGVSTELSPRADGAGLFFDDGRGIGLRMGGVTGVDATGKHCAGSVAFAQGVIELRLPADFIAGATLPLVVDPLMGSSIAVYTSGTTLAPDVAGDFGQVYLVVFERRWSAEDYDIHGQRINTSGDLVGGTLLFESTINNLAREPSVGCCNESNKWLVAWEQYNPQATNYDLNVIGRAAEVGNGNLGSAFTIAGSTSFDEGNPDVGGESVDGYDELIVVWDEGYQLNGGIRFARVTVPVSGSSAVASTHQLTNDGSDLEPRISKTGGDPGRYLITWEHFYTTPAPGDYDLYAALVSYDGTVLEPADSLASTVGPSEEHPDVDGDGTEFALVYEKHPAYLSTSSGIFARKLTYSGSTLQVGAEQMLDDDSAQEVSPAVGWEGPRYTATWQDGTFVKAMNVDAGDLSICELEYTVSVDGTLPAIAGNFSSTQGLASLIVYGNGDTKAQFISKLWGGSTLELGGGCAGGGTAGGKCAALAGSNFHHTLTGAAPNRPAFLLLAFERFDQPCGPCVIVPDPFSAFLFPVTTNSVGNASVATLIPNTSLMEWIHFYEQWAVVSTSPGCPNVGASFSNARRITFKE
jgi:hypothetical protein